MQKPRALRIQHAIPPIMKTDTRTTVNINHQLRMHLQTYDSHLQSVIALHWSCAFIPIAPQVWPTPNVPPISSLKRPRYLLAVSFISLFWRNEDIARCKEQHLWAHLYENDLERRFYLSAKLLYFQIYCLLTEWASYMKWKYSCASNDWNKKINFWFHFDDQINEITNCEWI